MSPPPENNGHSLTQGFASYLRARLQLLGIESLEALQYLQGKLLPVAIILACALSTYLLVIAAIVSLLGKWLSSLGKSPFLGWEIAALLVAGVHFCILLRFRKTLFQKPAEKLFEYTRAEIENDRLWLHENTNARKP